MRSGYRWVWIILCGLVLNACTPGTVDAPLPLTTTPTSAMPHLVVATFTPVAMAERVAEESTLTPADSLATPEVVPTGVAASVLPFTHYTVVPGDTLLGLALKYGLPMAVIQLQNDLGNSTLLKAGQELVIPPAVGWEGASPFWAVYEVQEGDVLSAIATDYGFDVATLQDVNGLADADLLSVGQALILPLTAPADFVLAENRPDPPTAVPLPAATSIPPVVAANAPLVPEDTSPAPTEIPDTAPVTVPALPADVAGFPADIFRLINEQRTAYGLAPLAWNATLARAAQLHADDCYARGWCGHTGSDSSTMKERIIRQGYDPVRWSECWAWYDTPTMAVAMWMDETPPNDPHRRTILSTWLTEVGVGVVPGNERGYYFIADFGTPR